MKFIKTFKLAICPCWLTPFIGIMLSLIAPTAKAQTRKDTLRQNYIVRLQRVYGIDPASAARFTDLEESFHASCHQLINDSSISYHAKTIAIAQMMQNKNNQLATLLTPEQILRIVPLREITTNADSLAQLSGSRYYLIKLHTDAGTALKVYTIYHNYYHNIYSTGRNDSISTEKATQMVADFARQRDLQFSVLLPPDKLAVLYPTHLMPKDLPVIPKEMAASAETFEKKIKAVSFQTNLSPQEKKTVILGLYKARRDSLQKVGWMQQIKTH